MVIIIVYTEDSEVWGGPALFLSEEGKKYVQQKHELWCKCKEVLMSTCKEEIFYSRVIWAHSSGVGYANVLSLITAREKSYGVTLR